MRTSLNGLRFRAEYLDLLQVDVSYSLDSKSFDARAVLRSTYHTAFLQHGLASLPPAVTAPPPAADDVEQATRCGVRRGQALAPAAAPAVLEPPSLRNANLVIGAAADQIYPSRLVSTSLDGASVNMGVKNGVVALLKEENPAVVGVHAIAHIVELAWADAIKVKPLIKRMLLTSQKAYTHYAGSPKKRLTFKACCKVSSQQESGTGYSG